MLNRSRLCTNFLFDCSTVLQKSFRSFESEPCKRLEAIWKWNRCKNLECVFVSLQLPSVNSFVILRCTTNISLLGLKLKREQNPKRERDSYAKCNKLWNALSSADRSYVLCFLTRKNFSSADSVQCNLYRNSGCVLVFALNAHSTIKHFAKR